MPRVTEKQLEARLELIVGILGKSLQMYYAYGKQQIMQPSGDSGGVNRISDMYSKPEMDIYLSGMLHGLQLALQNDITVGRLADKFTRAFDDRDDAIIIYSDNSIFVQSKRDGDRGPFTVKELIDYVRLR